MNFGKHGLMALVAMGSTGSALAQPVATYASGLLHQAVGGVSSTSVTERRLTACCLGSSGEDGVDVQLNSLHGGGIGVDLSPLTAVGREIRIRPKGWDGTIKGRIDMVATSSGSIETTVDFSDIGATALRTIELNPDGQVISDVITPGPILGFLDNPICPPPLTPTIWYTSGGWVVWGCGVGLDPYGDPYPYARIVQPVPSIDPADFGGIQSIECRGSNFPELTLIDASIGTFGVEAWGAGQAHVTEQCANPGGVCTPSSTYLVADNIGSSGNDGVAIDLSRVGLSSLSTGTSTGSGSTGGVGLRSRRCPDCPPGHITLIKIYDEAGRVMSVSETLLDPLTGQTELDADFSDIGATGLVITLLGPGGVVIGPPGGTEIISGGPRPYWSAFCPDGTRAIYINVGTQGNPVWQFDHCEGISTEITLPGGVTYGGVVAVQIEALSATMPLGRLTHCVMAATDTATMTVEDVDVTLLVRGDTDCSGVVDFFDIDPFLDVLFNPREYTLAHPACAHANADCNGSGVVDFFDIDPFLACLFGSCP